MKNLYSFIVNFTCLDAVGLRNDPGHLAMALVNELFDQVHPGLLTTIFQHKSEFLFTISPVIRSPNQLGKNDTLEPGWSGKIRLTFLENNYLAPLVQYLISKTRYPTLRLKNKKFAVGPIIHEPTSSPWASSSSIKELTRSHTIPSAITFVFGTPVHLLMNDEKIFFPLPRPVFTHLASMWQKHVSPSSKFPILETRIDEVPISQFVLQKKSSIWEEELYSGFIGWCKYNLAPLSHEDRNQLSALGNLALYCGLGNRTAQGMGQTRRVRDS